MSKGRRNKVQRATRTAVAAGVKRETHEPQAPLPNWPESHASVALTDSDADECIAVTIHGVTHYLHSTTARALQEQLVVKLDEWNANPFTAAVQDVTGLGKV